MKKSLVILVIALMLICFTQNVFAAENTFNVGFDYLTSSTAEIIGTGWYHIYMTGYIFNIEYLADTYKFGLNFGSLDTGIMDGQVTLVEIIGGYKVADGIYIILNKFNQNSTTYGDAITGILVGVDGSYHLRSNISIEGFVEASSPNGADIWGLPCSIFDYGFQFRQLINDKVDIHFGYRSFKATTYLGTYYIETMSSLGVTYAF